MSEAVFQQQPYLASLKSTITAIDGQWLELAASIFYPRGGGQPGDSGSLQVNGVTFTVLDTQKATDGAIRHQLSDENHGLSPGDSVAMQIDWPRRFRLMQMHSALHLLCSLIPKGVTGGSIGEHKSRLDFDLGEHSVDKQQLTEQLNALIHSNIPISQQWISQGELAANPGLVRTLSVKPPENARMVSLVNIQGVDVQPCGGTHVANSGEISELRVSKIENKGRRNRRIHIVFAEPQI
ncbi:MAG: alanyl-tRNA editing protein [Pseudomonadales bacterium]|nr:alanyl-tRNA editing protein [Pseudomonadales bacterium]NRA14712.1 alanyl-tRNA editing protein [Oceanospirillaceae bacterium]